MDRGFFIPGSNMRLTARRMPLVDSMLRKAVWLKDNKQNDSAEQLLMRTMTLSELWYYPKGVAESQGHLGHLFLIKNDLEQSKTYYLNAAYFLQQSGIRPGILANVYNALATVYARQGIRDSALVYYYHSLHVAETLPEKDTLLMATVYANIAGGPVGVCRLLRQKGTGDVLP